jgi:hypothetical protein
VEGFNGRLLDQIGEMDPLPLIGSRVNFDKFVLASGLRKSHFNYFAKEPFFSCEIAQPFVSSS